MANLQYESNNFPIFYFYKSALKVSKSIWKLLRVIGDADYESESLNSIWWSSTRFFNRTLTILRITKYTNLKSEFQNSKWRIQYSGQVHDFPVRFRIFYSDLPGNVYLRVSEVNDYKSKVRV